LNDLQSTAYFSILYFHMDTAIFHQTLKEHFGFNAFRPGQLEALEVLFQADRLLCIQPTGHGKSLLYQLPACILPGIVLVISPLLALMRDQVDQLNQRFKIRAGAIHSDQTEEENSAVRSAAAAGELSLLFLSPEQLDQIERFEFLLSLPLSLIVVDEAHCISTWGHDFRPAYRLILQLVKAAEEKNPKLKILGLTATAAKPVEKEILQLLFSDKKPGRVLRESMNRPNLSLFVHPVRGTAAKLLLTEELVKKEKEEHVGLIYCATRENTEMVARYLLKQGIQAIAYHAGLEGEDKKKLQQAFIQDQYQVVVATNALGMGIDKSNIRYVMHFDIPGSITAYYQEVGRAGRDGLPAKGMLLYDEQDRYIQEYFIHSAVPEREDFEKVLAMEGAPTLAMIKQTTGLHPTRVNVIVAELVEQGFLFKERQENKQVYRKEEKSEKPNLESYQIQKQVKLKELSSMLSYARLSSCRMNHLRNILGDLEAQNCGQCDICSHAPPVLVQKERLDVIDQWLLESPLTIPASRMSGLAEGISLLDSKLRSPLFVKFMKTRQETEEVDPELLQLLKLHLKEGLYQGIIALPSFTWKGRLSIAKAVSDFLKIPLFADLLTWKITPEHRQGTLLNNDQRKLNVQKKMEATHPIPAGPLLLLDDYTGSGATLKEAARALRVKGGKELILIPVTIATVKWKLGSSGFV
jgi:ATP-dependent DNA helicase RecQ